MQSVFCIMKNHVEESNKGLVTCVRLSRETRDRLAQMGNKDQTFDDIINVTIDKSLKNSYKDDLEETVSGEKEEESF